jgi:hypothetical protein
MEFFESIGWITLGFILTLVGLESAFRGTKRLIFYPKRLPRPTREKMVKVPF